MERFWVKSYDPGVPYEIKLGLFSSLVEMADIGMNAYGKNICFTNGASTLSYEKLEMLSCALAGFFQKKCGLKKGDRVAIMMPNLLQYPVTVLGALRAGLAVVNINPNYTPRELLAVLKDSEAKAIVLLEDCAQNLEKIIEQTAIETVIVTQVGDLSGVIRGGCINFYRKYIQKSVVSCRIQRAIKFTKALALSHVKLFRQSIIEPTDIAFIQYTGGTTAEPKGAVLTHGNMVSNVLQIAAWVEPMFKQRYTGYMVNPLPMYHIFSLNVGLLPFLKIGFANTLITEPRNIPSVIKELARRPFSVILGVNTFFAKLLASEGFRALNFSHLKFSLGGGMALQAPVAEEWQRVTGVPLLEAYGLTEASPAVTMTPLSMSKFLGSIGLPLPSTEVKICNDAGEEMPLGMVGEIYVRGPQIMRSYWNRPEQTKEAMTVDGWLRTGDIGVFEPNGFIRLIDRKNDVIDVSGFSVFPAEIEKVIFQMHAVEDVCVVGIKSSIQGEKIYAYVVKKEDDLTKEAILEVCRDNLTRYKIPREIVFVSEIPKNSVGKPLRRLLKEETEKAMQDSGNINVNVNVNVNE